MRSVILGVSLCLLAGCATVSMVPNEATVETSLSQNQSDLRKASKAYCDDVQKAGWTQSSNSLSELTTLLIHGRDGDDLEDTSYAARIGASTAAPALVLSRIVSDTEKARSGLVEVTEEARKVLSGGSENIANRADVMSYERALVRAQKAYHNFNVALSDVTSRDDVDMDVAPVQSELDAFATSIETARRTANGLADKYAALNAVAS